MLSSASESLTLSQLLREAKEKAENPSSSQGQVSECVCVCVCVYLFVCVRGCCLFVRVVGSEWDLRQRNCWLMVDFETTGESWFICPVPYIGCFSGKLTPQAVLRT